jgi:peptide/nickel transport system ATP-binding protein
MSEQIVASVRDLVVEFGGFRALDGVSLDIHPGEIVALVGESGSGKTVFGGCLLGLVPGSVGAEVTGGVVVGGVDMVDGSEADKRSARRQVLGAVFQDPLTSLDPMMRAGAQVIERGADRERGIATLAECGVPEPEERFSAWPHQLSGGLRQRVSIAGAITAETGVPSLLVADEPTTALDVRVQAQVIELFARLRDEHGCSVLLVTHDLGVAAQVADRIVVMSAGRIVEEGPTTDVIRRPQHAYTRTLLGSRMDVASDFPEPDPADPVDLTDTVMTVVDVRKDFPAPRGRGTRQVLHGVDLELGAGESLVLVGESGSGKSTLLRIAAGLETATAGHVDLARTAGRPQLIFQDARSSLTPWLSVGRQIGERLAAAGVPRSRRAARVAELLEEVGLDERMARSRPRRLSGGQCQRAAIARALAADPAVLFCDEPVSALDATLATRVVGLLDRLRRETGVSLLLVTHDLAVAKRVGTHIAVMEEGRIVERGTVREVFDRPQHPYTRALLAASPSLGPNLGRAAS